MKEIKCTENEKVALDYLGKSFVKTPRSIMDRLNSSYLPEQQMARLHLCLFGLCYHTDGYAILDNRKVVCRRGEYVGTQTRLAEIAGISIGSLSRLIKKMKKLHLITVNHIPGGSRIHVNGYDTFTWVTEAKDSAPDESPADAATQMAEAEKKMGGRKWE
ncbi:MAG: helix-turn-helix domain-containing protein [Parabacteroides gordonii]|nr:helix-turn-helix domain-containing protein [Parabacteroides gordonii]